MKMGQTRLRDGHAEVVKGDGKLGMVTLS